MTPQKSSHVRTNLAIWAYPRLFAWMGLPPAAFAYVMAGIGLEPAGKPSLCLTLVASVLGTAEAFRLLGPAAACGQAATDKPLRLAALGSRRGSWLVVRVRQRTDAVYGRRTRKSASSASSTSRQSSRPFRSWGTASRPPPRRRRDPRGIPRHPFAGFVR